MACGAARGQVPSDTSEQGAWGNWGAAAYCPQGQYVWGFRLKSEPYQGNGDDSALNAVQLICKSGVNGAATYIQSLEGKWGSWGRDHVCRETPAIAFAIQVERFQGRDKEKGLEGRYRRRQYQDELWVGNPRRRPASRMGRLDRVLQLPRWHRLQKKIRGFRTKVEPDQGSGDDTAMNAMQVYCGL
nr:hypothetical protein GCM10020185_56050 [Pseudomonas brassicacearum subsp. brassicacearum]